MAESGIDDWRGREVFTAYSARNYRAMVKAAALVEREVKKSFTRQGAGRRYGIHIASKPGQPPAIDTGTLRSSIISQVTKTPSAITGKVGAEVGVKYGIWLELGTVNMAPRPFLRPALRSNKKKIDKIFRDAND